MCIEELVLYTDDVDSLDVFYREVLELDTRFQQKGTVIELPLTTLHFLPSKQNTAHPYYHFAFNISENKIEESLNWLKIRDVLPVTDPTGSGIVDFKNWNAHSIYFLDPVGNVVEFIARHGLENTATGAFGGHMILSVSEIGMPVQDVRHAYDVAHAAIGVEKYSGNFTTFCPTGSEDGLLIITQRDRNWFPTDKPSLPFPFRAKLKNKDRRGTLYFDGDIPCFTSPDR